MTEQTKPATPATVSNFDVLKRMCAENLDIRLAPAANIISLKTTKKGTQITIGVAGSDVVTKFALGELSAFIIMFDVAQFDKLKKRMTDEAAASTSSGDNR